MTQTVPSKSTANVFYQGTARPRVPQAVLSQSTGRPYYPRMDNIRPRTSSFSPSTRSSTTRTPHRPQRPKKIMKSIWVKKESTVGSQAVLPQNVSVKGSAMINPTQTWRPKGAYLDSVNREMESVHTQAKLSDPEEDLKDIYNDNEEESREKEPSNTCIDFEKSANVEELKFISYLFSNLAPRKNDVIQSGSKGISFFLRSNLIGCKGNRDEAVLMAQKIGA
ncbi:hypothetical protein Tco_1369431 [Tanacetum coccineum]